MLPTIDQSILLHPDSPMLQVMVDATKGDIVSSGDEIEAGRTTTAESTTYLIGAIPSEQDVDFNGTAILHVRPQDGDLRPKNTLHGIQGVGSNPIPPGGVQGGTGVIGQGGLNRGTGVHAVAGGGGTGLHAQGGAGGVTSSITQHRAGPGLRSQGGTVDIDFLTEDDRSPQGPGVIASAGGSSQIPKPAETGNVGVFGQGADAVAHTRRVDSTSPPILLGPEYAGAGILGRGGINRGNNGDPDAPVVDLGGGAAGVVGISGGTPMPTPQQFRDMGVLGVSSTSSGVSGVSDSGPGVSGDSTEDRGGTFGSVKAPQLHLRPHDARSPSDVGGTPMPGDFLVTQTTNERGDKIASLYFCTSTSPGISWIKLA
ncbi:hypothetical protein [Actinomadura viridis]